MGSSIRYLGIAMRSSCLGYCLIVQDAIKKAGSISLECPVEQHHNRISNILSILKKDVDGHSSNTHGIAIQLEADDNWHVGVEQNIVFPRSVTIFKKQNHACRITALVEANCFNIFKCKPLFLTTKSMLKQMGKITNTLHLDNDTLQQIAKNKLKALESTLNESQFTAVAYAWVTATCTRRTVECEALKLDENIMRQVHKRVMEDKIVTELTDVINKEKDENTAKEFKTVLERRIEKLVNKHIQRYLP